MKYNQQYFLVTGVWNKCYYTVLYNALYGEIHDVPDINSLKFIDSVSRIQNNVKDAIKCIEEIHENND